MEKARAVPKLIAAAAAHMSRKSWMRTALSARIPKTMDIGAPTMKNAVLIHPPRITSFSVGLRSKAEAMDERLGAMRFWLAPMKKPPTISAATVANGCCLV